MKTDELGISKCLSCGKDTARSVMRDALKVKFENDMVTDISGAYCVDCGTISISFERIKGLTETCRKQQAEIASVSSKRVLSSLDRRTVDAIKSFSPAATTLYVHQGKVKCLTEDHDVISVSLDIPSLETKPVTINANYCFDCDRFFISDKEYEYYREKYPIMLVRFEYVSDNPLGMNLADKSPLMLAGYTVRADKKYSDAYRQNMLRNIIELGILKKHEVINYLNYFISMHGKAKNKEAAVEKWKADLEYVRAYNFELQNKARVHDIKGWR